MTSGTQQFEIRRIYSSSPAKAATIKVGARAGARISILGVLNLLAAGIWIYVAWWPADRLIGANLMTTGLARFSAAGGLGDVFEAAPPELANPAPPEGTEAVLRPVEQTPPGPKRPDADEIAAANERTMWWLTGTMWSWLGVMTIAGGWLALCGGAAAAGLPIVDDARRRSLVLVAIVLGLVAAGLAVKLWKTEAALGLSKTTAEVAFVALAMLVAWLLAAALPRRSAALAAAVLVLILIGGIASTGRNLGTGYPSAAPRIAATLGMTIAALIGTTAVRQIVGLHKAGVVLILLATVATLVALKLADSLGGVHTHTLTAATYAGIAALPILYAAVLLGALALRLR